MMHMSLGKSFLSLFSEENVLVLNLCETALAGS